jgi:transketolase
MKPHDSIRGYFAYELYKRMVQDDRIYLVTADLGYKMFDTHFKEFPNRVVNCGASEQLGVGMCVGLALEGKIPVFYSITNFVLYRPYEWLRNYLNHELIPVKLVGSGRDYDYSTGGWTHQCPDAQKVLDTLPNIETMWPETKEQVSGMVTQMLYNNSPTFLSLKR